MSDREAGLRIHEADLSMSGKAYFFHKKRSKLNTGIEQVPDKR